MGFVNIVNTNTFFLFQWKNCLKVTLIWILTIQHLNTQNVITGEGYNFLGTHFGGGRSFGLLTWEGLKFLALAFGVGEHNTKTVASLFLNLDNNRYSPKENFAKICQIKWNWLRPVKFEIVRIDFLVTVIQNFATMATWRNDFSPYYPGYQRFFYWDLTETGNRARKVSGTQGKPLSALIKIFNKTPPLVNR